MNATESGIRERFNLTTGNLYAQAGQVGVVRQQTTPVLPTVPVTGGIVGLQEMAQLQPPSIRGQLPLPHQTTENNIIPSVQALRTTAVNQDLVQQRLTELQQEALPQATGNAAYNNYNSEFSRASASVKKSKKEKKCKWSGHRTAHLWDT